MNLLKMNKNSIFIFVFLLILAYITNTIILGSDSRLPHFSTLATFIFIFYLINSNSKIKLLLASIILFFIALELCYFFIFGERVSTGVLNSIVETNIIESKSMLFHYLFSIIIPAIILSLLLIYIIKNKLPANPQFKILTLALYLLFLAFSISDFLDRKKVLLADFKEDPHELGQHIRNKYPLVFGDIAYIINAIYSNDCYITNKFTPVLNNTIITHHTPATKTIVLVIGESVLSKRLSAYGYQKQTTPNANTIFRDKHACIVSNVHSSAPITRNSISMSLTFYTPENEENLFKNKSIIQMAQDKGYKTYWLGSQLLKGVHGSKFGFIALNSDVIKINEGNDDKLTEAINEALADHVDYKFIIVHLQGSHQPYNNFSLQDKQQLPDFDDYDLTLYHTDSVLNNLYHAVNKGSDDYTFIYTSDHGEIVNHGHGFLQGIDQFLIPFMYKTTNQNYDCHFIESFRNNDGWISGLMNKYILSTLLGYQLDKHIVEKEKLHDRILNGNEEVQLFSHIQ